MDEDVAFKVRLLNPIDEVTNELMQLRTQVHGWRQFLAHKLAKEHEIEAIDVKPASYEADISVNVLNYFVKTD